MEANTCCPRCTACHQSIVREGTFFRADDSKTVQRFRCKDCGRKFSASTSKPTYRQKKRRINSTIRFCLASNMCPRDSADLVGVNIKTVASRLRWHSLHSREKHRQYLQSYLAVNGPIRCVQFKVTFKTDGHTHYAQLIKHYFPNAKHEVFVSDRGAVVGQGELKKTIFDNLFSANHTFATIQRLIKRDVTQTTTSVAPCATLVP